MKEPKRIRFPQLTVSKEIKNYLNELRRDEGISYSKLIEYLLAKAEFIDKSECSFDYILMHNYINKLDEEE